ATLRWTRLRVRLSFKERRMRFANATNINRKSEGSAVSLHQQLISDGRCTLPLCHPERVIKLLYHLVFIADKAQFFRCV
ncbi:MAG: hypothetical protein WCD57_20155, partial [Acidobacteriaceae bacterium]